MQKKRLAFGLLLLASVLCLAGCENVETDQMTMGGQNEETLISEKKNGDRQPDNLQEEEKQEEEKVDQNQFYVTVFTAVFSDNSSAEAFKDLLDEEPLTVDMQDYGSFEKVGEIGSTLPRNDEQIKTEPGDVILYLGTRITIYYGNVTVTFSLEKPE